jgi:AraC-like DNA-binding protein
MPSLPLPFIVALALLVLLGQLLSRRNGQDSVNRLFMVLVGVHALQSTVIGLRWGYGLRELLPLQSTLAAVLAALAWLCFRGLTSDGWRRPFWTWIHATPAALVLGLAFLRPVGVDLVLVAIFLGYGIALALLARQGPDALGRASFEGLVPTYGALWTTASALILSAILEVFVFLDMAWSHGAHAALVIGSANLFALLIVGGAAAVAGRSPMAISPTTPETPPPVEADAGDIDVVTRLDELMKAKGLFLDLDLSLDRLARRTLIPARRISAAVNRVTGKNVSQYINDYRVAEACRLLTETEESVTSVMFKAGFQTKSNFNREFLRLTRVSPSEWRASREAEVIPGDLSLAAHKTGKAGCDAPHGP